VVTPGRNAVLASAAQEYGLPKKKKQVLLIKNPGASHDDTWA